MFVLTAIALSLSVASAATNHVVTTVGLTFSPAKINTADAQSCAAVPNAFNSGMKAAGTSFVWKAATAGTVWYACGIPAHCAANMKGVIVVNALAGPAPAPGAPAPAPGTSSETAPASAPSATFAPAAAAKSDAQLNGRSAVAAVGVAVAGLLMLGFSSFNRYFFAVIREHHSSFDLVATFNTRLLQCIFVSDGNGILFRV
ncbi:hypothetical protein BDV3_002742 [Batrachochytrium dendrobatidis]